MAKNIETNCMTVLSKTVGMEKLELSNGVAYEIVKRGNRSFFSANFWCDFVGYDNSKLFGGSEVYLLVHGVPCQAKDLLDGSSLLTFTQLAKTQNESLVAACFFAGEFYPVKSIEIHFKGKKRVNVRAEIYSGEQVQSVEAEGTLRSKESSIEYPW
jgi:hypothetical protein